MIENYTNSEEFPAIIKISLCVGKNITFMLKNKIWTKFHTILVHVFIILYNHRLAIQKFLRPKRGYSF